MSKDGENVTEWRVVEQTNAPYVVIPGDPEATFANRGHLGTTTYARVTQENIEQFLIDDGSEARRREKREGIAALMGVAAVINASTLGAFLVGVQETTSDRIQAGSYVAGFTVAVLAAAGVIHGKKPSPSGQSKRKQ